MTRWLMCLALIACDPPISPRLPSVRMPDRQPAPVQERHPECVGSTETGPVLNVGCREHCLPRLVSRVCTDLGELLHVPHSAPIGNAFVRVMGEGGCWEIRAVKEPRFYTLSDFPESFVPPDGKPCIWDKYPKTKGWFGEVYGKVDFHQSEQAQIAE